jgi:hypothetical protein
VLLDNRYSRFKEDLNLLDQKLGFLDQMLNFDEGYGQGEYELLKTEYNQTLHECQEFLDNHESKQDFVGKAKDPRRLIPARLRPRPIFPDEWDVSGRSLRAWELGGELQNLLGFVEELQQRYAGTGLGEFHKEGIGSSESPGAWKRGSWILSIQDVGDEPSDSEDVTWE